MCRSLARFQLRSVSEPLRRRCHTICLTCASSTVCWTAILTTFVRAACSGGCRARRRRLSRGQARLHSFYKRRQAPSSQKYASYKEGRHIAGKHIWTWAGRHGPHSERRPPPASLQLYPQHSFSGRPALRGARRGEPPRPARRLRAFVDHPMVGPGLPPQDPEGPPQGL